MMRSLASIEAISIHRLDARDPAQVHEAGYDGRFHLLTRAFLGLAEKSPAARRWLFKHFFDLLARMTDKLEWWTLMNYGYADISGTAVPLLLDRRDEAERTCIQLYDHVIGDVDLTGKDVLEVSSGRGGGASYVSRYLGPRSVVGVDISPRAIAFCRRVHKTPGLRFRVGDAEGIPAEDDSVDAVINVEASFCYANLDVFLAEVTRVLRPGGHFFYTDLRLSDEIDDWMAALRRCDLDLLHVEDITENVVHALEIDERRRTIAADRLSPIMLRQAMRTFSGAKGTRYPTLLKDRRLQYYSFVLRKNGACAAAVPFSS